MSHASVAPNALRGTLHCVTDRQGQRGFTLVETLVAIAIFVIVAAVVTAALQHALNWGRTVAARQAEHAQFEALVDRLHADEDTAWAIFTPGLDVLGQSNADGHEVDMFTRDGDNRPYFWAYRYDATAQTITKYLYAKPGAAALADSGSIVPGVASFSAATYTIDKLADASSPIYNPLYSGKSLTPVAIHYGYGPEVAGGNQITTVTMSGTTIAESLQLSTQTAPSGWTVRFHYSKGTLSVVPARIVYAVAGKSLGYEAHESGRLAFLLNALLGGAVASASTCTAKAVDATGVEIRPGSSDAAILGIVDPSGCYDGHIIAQEPGFKDYFNFSGNSCTSLLVPRGWVDPQYDPARGPGPDRFDLSAQSVEGNCSFAISDSIGVSSKVVNVQAQVVSYFCPAIRDSCTVTGNPWPNDGPGCDTQGGGFQNGYSGIGSYSTIWGTTYATAIGSTIITPYGTITVNADQSITFVRTALGSLAVNARDQYLQYSVTMNKGGYTCKVLNTAPTVAKWIF